MKTQLETSIELGTKALQEENYNKAESLFREALQEAQTADNELLAATCFDSLGEIYFRRGDLQQAETFYQQAMVIRRRHLSPGHEDIVASLNNLSSAYFFQGKYRLAKPLCEQLVATYEAVLGKGHPEIATCLINLGLIAMAEGKLSNAEKRFLDAHAIRSAAYDPSDILVGNSLWHLGNIYSEQERYDLASETLQQSLSILEKQLSPADPDLEKVVSTLSIALEHLGKFAELEQLYPRLVNLTEIKLGPAHPEVAKYLETLANLYLKLQRYEDAEKVFQRLLSMKRRALGENHPEAADQLRNLALVKEALKHSGQAETLYLQAIIIYENYKRRDTGEQATAFLKYLETIKSLAAFYDRERRFAKADKQWQQLLQVIQRQAANYPYQFIEGHEHFSQSLYAQNKFAEAKQLLQKALRFLEEGASGQYKQMDASECKLKQASIITRLADILKAEGNFSEAEAHYEQALESLTKTAGSSHPDLIPALQSYADLLARTYREAEAEHIIACATDLSKKAGMLVEIP